MGDKRTWDCVKIPFQVIIDLLNGFIPLSPPPLLHSPHSHPLSFPPMVLLSPTLISTHGADNSTLFGVGGEGH